MNKRWKPSNSYYIVNSVGEVIKQPWDGDVVDVEFYEFGNCFETKEQAEDVAIKVKELFLSMSGEAETSSAQLPKLTEEVFNHPDCPEWAQYAAVDKDGKGFYYQNKPTKKENKEWSLFGVVDYQYIGKFDASDWRNSLVERPAKLTDWCKVGEWVYSTVHNEYVKVKDIDEFKVVFDRGTYHTVSHKAFREDYRPARLRPYNADEMQKLVGKVLELAGNRDLVTSYDKDSKEVYADSMWMSADELLSNGYTIDGELCSVLEHLEDGEWVK